jgi:hypothetical protein
MEMSMPELQQSHKHFHSSGIPPAMPTQLFAESSLGLLETCGRLHTGNASLKPT